MNFQGGGLNVFAGVPVDGDDREWDGLQQRLLDVEDSCGAEVSTQGGILSKCGHLYTLSGAIIGTSSASLGLAWLDSVPMLGTVASIFSSMIWSFTTSFVSYICFRLCVNSVYAAKPPKTFEKLQRQCGEEPVYDEPSEYYFCFGVFFGFCSMCLTHDILKGYPIRETLLLTGFPFIIFTTLFVYAKRRFHIVHDPISQSRPTDAIV